MELCILRPKSLKRSSLEQIFAKLQFSLEINYYVFIRYAHIYNIYFETIIFTNTIQMRMLRLKT